jgi:hypothetical protein
MNQTRELKTSRGYEQNTRASNKRNNRKATEVLLFEIEKEGIRLI